MKILLLYKGLPENFRLVLTAILGAGIGFITYEIIYYFNPLTVRAGSSWFLAYLIGVVRQHALHRYLTFSDESSYWRSLLRAYIMYSGSIILTTGLNWYLTEILSIHHRIAWFCCLIMTALISLVFLKRFVFKLK